MGTCGGVDILLGLCQPVKKTRPRLLLPVLRTLRHSLHNNKANKKRLLRADGLEILVQVQVTPSLCGMMTIMINNDWTTCRECACNPSESLEDERYRVNGDGDGDGDGDGGGVD